MEDPFEVFNGHLKSRGIRGSKRREEVLKVFLDASSHLSMAELFLVVRRRCPGMGLATVYRTMRLICEAGLADEIDFGDGTKRFERKDNQPHHDHLICESCGGCIELDDKEIELLQSRLAVDRGFTLTRHKMYLFGICPECRQKGALARKGGEEAK